MAFCIIEIQTRQCAGRGNKLEPTPHFVSVDPGLLVPLSLAQAHLGGAGWAHGPYDCSRIFHDALHHNVFRAGTHTVKPTDSFLITTLTRWIKAKTSRGIALTLIDHIRIRETADVSTCPIYASLNCIYCRLIGLTFT